MFLLLEGRLVLELAFFFIEEPGRESSSVWVRFIVEGCWDVLSKILEADEGKS